LSYDEKLAAEAERAAKRLGGHFVPNEFWPVVVEPQEAYDGCQGTKAAGAVAAKALEGHPDDSQRGARKQ
jgi:hypothetical protein